LQNTPPGNDETSATLDIQGEVVQGGLKTQEMPMEDVPENRLLEEIDFSPELTARLYRKSLFHTRMHLA
jgi:hypothetical protein